MKSANIFFMVLSPFILTGVPMEEAHPKKISQKQKSMSIPVWIPLANTKTEQWTARNYICDSIVLLAGVEASNEEVHIPLETHFSVHRGMCLGCFKR